MAAEEIVRPRREKGHGAEKMFQFQLFQLFLRGVQLLFLFFFLYFIII